jgi:hypothetical protein
MTGIFVKKSDCAEQLRAIFIYEFIYVKHARAGLPGKFALVPDVRFPCEAAFDKEVLTAG